MDKRKAYAIVHPVREYPRDVLVGHRWRENRRVQVTLYCNGVAWVARIERLDAFSRPVPLAIIGQDGSEQMAVRARLLLIAADCGDGEIRIGVGAAHVEAWRQMMPSEQAALAMPTAPAL